MHRFILFVLISLSVLASFSLSAQQIDSPLPQQLDSIPADSSIMVITDTSTVDTKKEQFYQLMALLYGEEEHLGINMLGFAKESLLGNTSIGASMNTKEYPVIINKEEAFKIKVVGTIPAAQVFKNYASPEGQQVAEGQQGVRAPLDGAFFSFIFSRSNESFPKRRFFFQSNYFLASGLIALNIPRVTNSGDENSLNPAYLAAGVSGKCAVILDNIFTKESEDKIGVAINTRIGLSTLLLKKDHAFYDWMVDDLGNPTSATAINFDFRVSVVLPRYGFSVGYNGRQSINSVAKDDLIWGGQPAWYFNVELPFLF